MNTAKRFSVYWIEEITDKQSGEPTGGEDGFIWETDDKAVAFRKAIMWSKKKQVNGKKLHETFVYEHDRNQDVVGHWYFKNGAQSTSMFD